MESGELRRSAGVEADEKVARRGGLLRRLRPCDGDGRGRRDEGRYDGGGSAIASKRQKWQP